MYVDLVLNSLNEAARRALRAMDPAKYEYQSDFAKQYIAVGKAEGKAEGKTEGLAEGQARGKLEIVLKLLALRFGPLPESVQAKIHTLEVARLDVLAERILRATTLEEVMGEV